MIRQGKNLTVSRKPLPGYVTVSRDDPIEDTNHGNGPHLRLEDNTTHLQYDNKTDGSLSDRTEYFREYTPVPMEENGVTRQHAALTWRPSYLRRRVLLSFMAIFLAVLCSIEAIYQVSEKRQGIAATRESWHYLWKYGPTAVFVTLAAVWSRVVYQARMTAPWVALAADKPIDASHSVLLDYLSDLEVAILLRAMRRGDHLIWASTMCAWMMKLLLVFSTGLLVLSNVAVYRSNFPVTIQDFFSSTAANSTIHDKGDSIFPQTGSLPFLIIDGLMEKDLVYPDGTTAQLSFQTFESFDAPPNSLLEATVDGFVTDMQCERASLIINEWKGFRIGEPYHTPALDSQNLTFASDSCTIPSVDLDLSTSIFNSTRYWGAYQQAECNARNNDLSSNVVLISAGELAFELMEGELDSDTYSFNVTAPQVAAVICRPTYAISKVDVVRNNTKSASTPPAQVHISSDPHNHTLEALHRDNVTQTVFGLFETIEQFGEGHMPYDSFRSPYNESQYRAIGPFNPALRFHYRDKGIPDVQELIDVESLENIARSLYQVSAAQLAAQFFKEQFSSQSTGSITTRQDRLVVQLMPARVLEAILGVITLLAIPLVVLAPRVNGVAPRNPGSTANMLIFLTQSPQFLRKLRGTGIQGVGAIRRRLKQYDFQSTVLRRETDAQSPFGIRISKGDGGNRQDNATTPLQETQKEVRRPEREWWEPLPVKTMTWVPVCVGLAGIIAALEICLHQSDKNEGLGSISRNSNLQYLAVYVPAAVMVSIGLYLSSLDFIIKSLAPFSELRRGRTAAISNTLQLNFFDHIGPRVLIKAIRTQRWAVLLCAIGTIISPLLTIISSGLFEPRQISLTREVELQTQSRFNETEPNVHTKDDSRLRSGVSTTGLIFYRNLSFPAWTYDEFAFDRLALLRSDPDVDDNNDGTTITVKAPALRSTYNCRTAEAKPEMRPWDQVYLDGQTKHYLHVESATEWCRPAKGANITGWNVPVTNDTYIHTRQTRDDFFACSDYVFIWGQTEHAQLKHFAIIGCNETIQNVDVEVTLSTPDLAIDLSTGPPTADESTVRNSSVVMPELDTRYLPEDIYLMLANDSMDGGIGFPFTDLGQPDRNDAVAESLVHTMKIMRAQQFNTYSRIPISAKPSNDDDDDDDDDDDGNNDSRIIRAQATYHNHLRIVQDSASTRVLEALLAVLLLCIAIVNLLSRSTKKLLPKNPCSLAATASLLADSNLMRDGVLPEGVEGMNDVQIEGASGWNNWRVRMGWGEGPRSRQSHEDESSSESSSPSSANFAIWLVKSAEPDPNPSTSSLGSTNV